MQIDLTGGHNVSLTPALRDFTQAKFDKLDRFYDKITSAHVIFNVEKLRQIVEATVQVSHGELHASAESQDMYASVDELVDKLQRQLMKHKEKERNHREH